MDGANHARALFDGSYWTYAMSRDAVWITPRDILVKRIAMHLAENIATDLKRKYPSQ